MATCPECDAEVDIDPADVDLGDEMSCPECGQTLVISNTDPLELDFAPDDDEDEDEDEDDDLDGDDDEDDLDDEGEDEDGADWEEE
jgi:alpha-aminoadipate/glutamate carrier protein LysW